MLRRAISVLMAIAFILSGVVVSADYLDFGGSDTITLEAEELYAQGSGQFCQTPSSSDGTTKYLQINKDGDTGAEGYAVLPINVTPGVYKVRVFAMTQFYSKKLDVVFNGDDETKQTFNIGYMGNNSSDPADHISDLEWSQQIAANFNRPVGNTMKLCWNENNAFIDKIELTKVAYNVSADADTVINAQDDNYTAGGIRSGIAAPFSECVQLDNNKTEMTVSLIAPEGTYFVDVYAMAFFYGKTVKFKCNSDAEETLNVTDIGNPANYTADETVTITPVRIKVNLNEGLNTLKLIKDAQNCFIRKIEIEPVQKLDFVNNDKLSLDAEKIKVAGQDCVEKAYYSNTNFPADNKFLFLQKENAYVDFEVCVSKGIYTIDVSCFVTGGNNNMTAAISVNGGNDITIAADYISNGDPSTSTWAITDKNNDKNVVLNEGVNTIRIKRLNRNLAIETLEIEQYQPADNKIIEYTVNNDKTANVIEDNTMTGNSVNLYARVKNTTESDRDIHMIIAGYDAAGMLKNVEYGNTHRTKSGKSAVFDIDYDCSEYDSIKVFVWDYSDCIPFCKNQTFRAARTEPIEDEFAWDNMTIGGGGYVINVTSHPSGDGTLYVNVDCGGVYKSENGAAWTQLFDGLPKEKQTYMNCYGVAVDNNNSDIVYALAGDSNHYTQTHETVLKSADGGKNWVESDLNISLKNGTTYDGGYVAIDPLNSNILCCAADDGIYRSANGGINWAKIFNIDGFMPAALTFGVNSNDTDRSSVVYALCRDKGVYKSENGGSTWNLMSGSPVNMSEIVVNTKGDLFTAGFFGIYKYTGAQWKCVMKLADGAAVKGMDINKNDNSKMVAVTGAGKDGAGLAKNYILVSNDYGESWTKKLNNADGSVELISSSSIAFDNTNLKSVYITDWFGVYKIDDIYADKYVVKKALDGIENTVVYDVTAANGDYKAFACVADVDMWYWNDNSAAGLTSNNSLTVQSTTDIDYCEENPDFMVRGALRNDAPTRTAMCLYSTDGGKNWANMENLPLDGQSQWKSTPHVAVSAGLNTNGVPTILFSAQPNGGIYYTEDCGQTWNKSTGIDAFGVGNWSFASPLVSDRAAKDVFYAVCNGNVYVSVNGGKDFNKIISTDYYGTVGSTIEASPVTAGEFWVANSSGTGNGLYHFTEYGNKCVKAGQLISPEYVTLGAAAPGSSYQTVYAYESDYGSQGIYTSIDNGVTWRKISNDANKFCRITGLSADKNNYGTVYAGTRGRGVFKGVSEIADTGDLTVDTNFYPGWVRKAVTFSWDDNDDANLTVLEKLNNANIPSTFNFIASWIPVSSQKEAYIGKFKGHEVSSHTYWHSSVHEMSIDEAKEAVAKGRQYLSAYAGYDVVGLAWPNGINVNTDKFNYKTEFEPWLKNESGVEYARTTYFTHGFDLPEDWWFWKLTGNTQNYDTYLPQLLALADDGQLKLLAMFDHPEQYRTLNMWDRLDSMLTELDANRDKLWIDTNINVCRYIKAHDKLVVTETSVRNPTSIDQYVKIGGKKVIVKAGKTVYFR